jgi:hypothetical protein
VPSNIAFEELHHQKFGAVLRTDVVELADVSLIQGGDGARLAFEAPLDFMRIGRMRSENFATVRSSRVSFAL